MAFNIDDLPPDVAALLKELVAKGRILIVEGPDNNPKLRLDTATGILLKVLNQELPLTEAPKAVRLFLSVTDEALGAVGTGEPRALGTYQPQREGLVDAADTLVQGKREGKPEFFNARFEVDETARLGVQTRALQEYSMALSRHLDPLDHYLWPKELRLYKTLSGSWEVLGPAFRKDQGLQEWGPKLWVYMTGRPQKAVGTRKDNAALRDEWEANKSAAVKADVEEKVREKTVGDLVDSFVAKLDAKDENDPHKK